MVKHVRVAWLLGGGGAVGGPSGTGWPTSTNLSPPQVSGRQETSQAACWQTFWDRPQGERQPLPPVMTRHAF